MARVIGPVVDVEFAGEEMPDIYNALQVDITLGGETQDADPGGGAAPGRQHGPRHLHGSRPTAWSAGPRSTDTGGPITVPVGDVTKGHVFNVLGEPLDVPTPRP